MSVQAAGGSAGVCRVPRPWQAAQVSSVSAELSVLSMAGFGVHRLPLAQRCAVCVQVGALLSQVSAKLPADVTLTFP